MSAASAAAAGATAAAAPVAAATAVTAAAAVTAGVATRAAPSAAASAAASAAVAAAAEYHTLCRCQRGGILHQEHRITYSVPQSKGQDTTSGTWNNIHCAGVEGEGN